METLLVIEDGSFYDAVIPESVESLWGPVPLGKYARLHKCSPDNPDPVSAPFFKVL